MHIVKGTWNVERRGRLLLVWLMWVEPGSYLFGPRPKSYDAVVAEITEDAIARPGWAHVEKTFMASEEETHSLISSHDLTRRQTIGEQ